jgi:hypothetical protein
MQYDMTPESRNSRDRRDGIGRQRLGKHVLAATLLEGTHRHTEMRVTSYFSFHFFQNQESRPMKHLCRNTSFKVKNSLSEVKTYFKL